MEPHPFLKKYDELFVAMVREQNQLRDKYEQLFLALQEECPHEGRYIDHVIDWHSGEYEDKWCCPSCRKMW